MATYLTSNIFSDIYVGGNCVVKGTMTVSGGGGTTQWTTSGLNIYYNTGNVGIGIATPTYKLHISSGDTSLALFGPNTSWGYYLAVGAATSAISSTTAQVITTNGNLHLDAAATGASGRGIYINYYTSANGQAGGNGSAILSFGPWTHTGNFGIGVTPAYPLHVTGDINFTGSLRQNGTVYAPSSQWTGTAGSTIYYAPFVGIGSTLTPTANLMVTGNIFVSNAIQTTNIVAAGFTSNATTTTFACDTLSMPFVNATQVTAASSVGIGTTLPAYTLDVYGSMNCATVSSSTGLMFRNRLINGDMRINQRGATASPIVQNLAGGQFFVDRWVSISNQTTGYFVNAVQTLAPSDTPYQYGFRYSMRCTAATGAALPASGYIYPFYQNIEGSNISDLNWGSSYGVSVTVSFWFRSNMAAGSTGSVSIRNAFSSSAYVLYNATFTVVGGGAWQYVAVTVPAPANGTTWNTGTTTGIEFLPVAFNNGGSASGWVTGSANTGFSGQTTWWTTTGNYIEITGAQLEKGPVATPFEFKPLSAELALCQRYFCKTFSYSTTPAAGAGQNGSIIVPGCSTTGSSGSAYAMTWFFPVEMVQPPTTVSLYNPSNAAGGSSWFDQFGNSIAASSGQAGTRGVFIYNSASASGVGRNAVIHATASAEF